MKKLGHAVLRGILLVAICQTAACGSGDGNGLTGAGGAGPTGGGGSGAGASSLTWKEGGKSYAALFATGTRVISAGLDMLQVTGANSTGAGLSFGVGDMSPPLTLDTYSCGGSNGGAGPLIVSMAYTSGGSVDSLVPTCTITLGALGATAGSHATGTFSGSLPLSNGATATITDGKFDVALTVSML